eukprot:gene8339-17169_t
MNNINISVERDFSESLVKELGKLQSSGYLTDVTIKCGNSEVRAHRCVLAASSEYFRASFTNSMKESELGTIVELKQVDEGCLDAIIKYIYNGSISLSDTNVLSMLDSANHLQLSRLVQKCCDFLFTNLDIDNCLNVHSISDTYSCLKLSKQVEMFIYRNFESITLSNEFNEIAIEKLLKYLSNNQLTISNEEKLFHAIVKWISHDENNRIQYISKLLSSIRLELMLPQTIAHVIHNCIYLKNNPLATDVLLQAYKWHCTSDILKDKLRKDFIRKDAIRPCLYIFGGDDGFDDGNPYSDVSFYNIETSEWTHVKPLCNRRSVCGTIVINSSKVLIVGGYDGEKAMEIVELFDTHSNRWDLLPPLRQRRCSCHGVVLGEEIYVLGGVCGPQALSHVESFNFRRGTWIQRTPMTERIFAIGGINAFGDALACGEVYDPNLQEWRVIASMSTARRSFGLAVIDTCLYAVGGNDGVNDLRTVEAFDIVTGLCCVFYVLTKIPHVQNIILHILESLSEIFMINLRSCDSIQEWKLNIHDEKLSSVPFDNNSKDKIP